MKSDEIQIRETTSDDLRDITEVEKLAFGYDKEAELTMGLLADNTAEPRVSLLAFYKGEAIGHILFTKTYVTRSDGSSRFDTLLVAPLSVLQEYWGQGIGSALMKEGLRLAKEMGYKTAFLCGDPNYYSRLGYKPTHLYGIHHESIPDEYVMVYELEPDSLKGVAGIINM